MRSPRRSGPTSWCRCAIITRSRRPGADATLLLMPAWTEDGRAFHRLQDRHGVSRQRQGAAPVGLRAISAALGRDRRAAGDDGWPRAHRVAHRLRVGARGALSRARGCLASGDGGRRRAGAASHSRACQRAADQARLDLEPHERARDLARLRHRGCRHRSRYRRNAGRGGERSRHRILRDARRPSR